MIKQIHVQNFKTLRDVTIPLAPKITVMVGPNNSGKSNALAVLKLLGATTRGGSLQNALQSLGGLGAISPRPQGGDLRISVVAELFTGGESNYVLANSSRGNFESFRTPATQSGSNQERDPNRMIIGIGAEAGGGLPSAQGTHLELKALCSLLSGISVFDLSVASLRAPSIVQQGARLGPDGQNAGATLDALGGEHPDIRDAIEAEVKMAAPDVKRLLARPTNQPGTKILGIEEKGGGVFGAEAMSDGLVLFVGMSIAAQMTAPQHSLIAIEEPERGIHPRRLRELLDQFIRIADQGTQVVLTTHSPQLLDEFRDYPESVLIFDRDEGGTHVTRLSDKPEWMEDLKEAPLGDIWYSGILGGVPKP